MSDRLMTDQALGPGESIASANGRAVLTMQSDGNLVLQEVRGGERTTHWATGTSVPGSRVVMQSDGNLALYGPGGDCHWATGTDGNPGASLVLQDDGNLVIYGNDGAALWASGTTLGPAWSFKGDRLQSDQALEPDEGLRSHDGRALAVMQADGNLVVYQATGDEHTALWATGTSAAGSRAIMQDDGNLVVYGPDGVAHWAAGTDGNPGAWLVIQDDGNLVIYAAAGGPLWASNTRLAD